MARGEMRPVRSALSDLFDWFDEGFPPALNWRSMAGAQGMRIEDLQRGDRYVIRAELPGIDPDRDVEITVAEGVLTIRAERQEEHKDTHRSEFRYGSFARRIPLPVGADEDDIAATYRSGILEVSVGLKEAVKREAKRITVSRPE